jgi:hypothetical protein
MSMNSVFRLRTVCEVIREINDLNQGDSDREKLTREKLAEAEKMTKRMAQGLAKYKTALNLDRSDDFSGIAENIDYADDKKRRSDKNYKYVG